ncbi:hypothetical protein Taro_004231 [Colocasia esculenta]|uniref:Uncharacterized protein n=1 Tax=Colocasia esculenta TaxID=4460 RepID=A0A843TR13_COLES|nr:hypothetical protein [Colocasia esculenta]
MARCGGATVIVISSSSSSSSSDEENLYERAQKLKLRTQFRLFKCRGRNGGGGGKEEEDDDCVILEKDPFLEGETEVARAIADLPRKLSLSLEGGGDRKDDAFRLQVQHGGEGEEEGEVTVVAERGKVALRDYPHSRHLCVKHPFSKTPHEKYCDQCYCYVCDKPAPCEKWKDLPQGHCNATDQDDLWKKLRKATKSGP